MPVPNSIDDLSTTPSENFPVGTEQVFPNLDDYMRAMSAFIAQLRDRVDAEGLPLAATQWWGGARSAIQARFAPQDGQLLNRSDYPALWVLVSSGGYPLVTEVEWQASPLKRAAFSSGNGSTTFRLPDLNGKQANSIGAVTTRGDGTSSSGAPGLLQDSQNLTHAHGASASQEGAHAHYVSGSTSTDGYHTHGVPDNDSSPGRGDAFDSGGNPAFRYVETTGAGAHAHSFSGNAAAAGSHVHAISIASDGGSEARMKSATGAWVMRVK